MNGKTLITVTVLVAVACLVAGCYDDNAAIPEDSPSYPAGQASTTTLNASMSQQAHPYTYHPVTRVK